MEERKCIWCCLAEPQVTFVKEAHIVPQSLGGKRVCKNVCDACNAYFGNKRAGVPSVEEAIKETFAITRDMILLAEGEIGKTKKRKWHSSLFFKVDFVKRSVSVKPAYRLRRGFQEMMSRQVARGLYKMLLETIEADSGTALDPKYDFIREFARYDLGDYPVFYFLRRLGLLLTMTEAFKKPEILIMEPRMKYLLNTDSFVEFEFLGHVIGLPKSKQAYLVNDQYMAQTREAKLKLFHGFVLVKYFNDIDLSLNVLKDGGGYERWLLSQYGTRLWLFAA